ncbi:MULTISPECIES: hypothetical protein [Brevundimonas]|jgi:hypothetical protein|uniref:Acyl-CoA transferase n=1 Tax=Brevundimonas vancanneytii TaxID=1325724 RepID=A0A4P1JRC7_9CAUL|nr:MULTISPECIES: hypothetical protein [Brevundimonas]VTO10687.1 Uncharacterised protein [Brevundimonas vancanneytii]
MTLHRHAVADALEALLKRVFPNAEVKRDAEAPSRPPAGGLVILRDSDPGEPEVTLSPLSYSYNHAFGVEIVSPSATGSHGLGDMLAELGEVIEGARDLGGLTEWLEATAPDLDDLAAAGAPSVATAMFDLIATYTIPSPLH